MSTAARPATPQRRPARPALLIRLLLGVLAVLLAITGLGPPSAAVGPDPTAGPARKDPLPVTVELTSISPTLSTGDVPIEVTAELTNTGDQPITDMWARLQRDARIGDRAGLLKVDQKQPAYGAAAAKDTTLDITLEPGQTSTIELTVPRTQLAIYDSGAYPVLLNVQGTIEDEEGRVGQVAFTLPRVVGVQQAAVPVAWVLPLVDRPHRGPDPDTFLDEELASLIAPGGRLEVILGAAETFGETAQLTLFLDPALVDQLVAMSDGYQVDAENGTTAGTGDADAAAFLDRLRALAETTPIAITPYADVDVVALVRAGLGQVVQDARALGAKIVEDALQTIPATDIAWPADGIITENALLALREQQVTQVLLGGASFGQRDYLSSDDGVTENAATALPGIRGVVADPGLTRLIGDAPDFVGGPVAAAQRVAAELATIVAEAPDRGRDVVLVPPRQWNPSPALITQLLTLTTTAEWITPVPLQQVAESEPQDRGVLEYPADLSNRELPTAALGQLQPVITQVGELSTAFAEGSDRQTVLGPIQAATYRAASSAWRGSEQEVLDGAGHAADAIEAVREKIRIVPPSNGSYTLSASDAPLVFTIENNLRVPVSFRIGLDPRLSSGLVPADIGVQTIPALSRSTVRLPTKVKRSGTFSVVAQIMTPESKPLGKDVRVQVSSSAYGAVALIVTGGAFALLLLLIARRWWRKRLFWAEQRAEEQAARESEQGVAPATDGDPAEPERTEPERTERRRGRGGTVRSHEARDPGPDPRLEDEPR